MDQALALKAIAKAWKISVETSRYDPAFVAMVKRPKKEATIEMLIRMVRSSFRLKLTKRWTN